ncbi:hypothetical protein L7F22_059149 [Adiantum nelumboides]|nr:hypothetical protein [Adiantum nelumboides]
MLHESSHPLHSAGSLGHHNRPSWSKTLFSHPQFHPSQVKLAPCPKCHVLSLVISVPAINPDDPQPPAQPLYSPSPSSSPLWPSKLNPSSKGSPRSQEWRVYANNDRKNGRWHKDNETALSQDEPLPLPMVYPDSSPNPQEVEDMKNCDPEKKDCKDVLYQWIGKCSRCQGTGEVSFFRKKGREIICKCIPCMGLGKLLPKAS